MKAIRIERHGGSDVMALAEVALPKIAPGEVLIEVHAASINPVDWKIRDGALKEQFMLQMPHVLGRDFAGTVAAIGEDIRRLAVGDRVWGVAPGTAWGSHAEFLAVEESFVGHIPNGLTDVDAAAIPLAALSALAGINAAKLVAGERILIHAGAGGVGGLAIQMAKHRGAEVATTASARNAEHVRALGADIAIDYASGDFAEAISDCDVVLDTMGGEVHRRSFAVLKRSGRLAYLIAMPFEKTPPRADVSVIHARVAYDHESLERIAAMVEVGAITPQVGVTLPLERAKEGYDMSRTGHVRGKIVLTV